MPKHLPKTLLLGTTLLISNLVFGRGHFSGIRSHVKWTNYWYFGLLVPILLVWLAMYYSFGKGRKH